MKFTASLILAVSLFPAVKVEGTLNFLFNLLFRPFIQNACTAGTEALGLDGLTCQCDVEFIGLFQGVEGDVSCGVPSTCFGDPSVCATGNVEASLAASLFSGVGLDGDVSGCLNVTTINGTTVPSSPGICLTFTADGLALDGCTATVNSSPCTSCDVCSGGTSFKFNCSNVNLLPPDGVPDLYLPAVTTCLGLDLASSP